MATRFRSDLQALLLEFAEQHRGVRVGKMFGRPAIYAGRRLVTSLIDDGIIVRLPEDVARVEIRAGAEPFGRGGQRLGSWVKYRPRGMAAARRLAPILEIAVRSVAEREVGGITGVRRRRK